VGQKVHPKGFRVGITEDWESRWFAPGKGAYGEFLVEDERLRRFIDGKLNRQPPFASVSRVEIERTRDEVRVILHTARPGIVIGPRGAEIEKLRATLEGLIQRRVDVQVREIRNPDVDAQLVAESVAEQLRRRASFRRVMKQRCEAALQAGAKGVKIICSGRLGGAEMSRRETQQMGSIPLQTLQAKVDYGYAIARTTYGAIGVRAWVHVGRYGEEQETVEGQAPPRPPRRGRRG
jgi:small subunit ribosomal protein S3